MQKNICVIVPTFNRYLITKDCVERLQQQTLLPTHIILCDSNSSDETPSLVGLDRVSLVKLSHHHWWAAAVNEGLEKAIELDAEYILIINDDVLFDSSLVSELYDVNTRSPEGITIPIQVDSVGEFTGIKYSEVFKLPRKVCLETTPDVTNGCCIFFNAKILSKTGRMDSERFPHLCADFNFFIKSRKSGVLIDVAPNARIVQLPNTNYLKKIPFKRILTAVNSPLNVKAHYYYGKELFNGNFGFLVFGVIHNLKYIFNVFKISLKKIYE